MSKKYYYLLAIPVIAFAVVLGVGLWKTSQQTKGKTGDTNTEQTGEQPWLYPEKTDSEDADQAKRASLIASIDNYREATSFRSTIWRPYNGDEMRGNVEYVKPLRMHALLSLPKNKQETELIFVGETSYLKDTDGSWKIVNDSELKQFGRDFFTGMLMAGKGLASFGVPDDASIYYTNNREKDCTEAKTQYQEEKGLKDISFCFNEKNVLVYVWMQTSDGEVLTEYSDFNALLSVERPPLPLLEHRLEITQ